MSLHTELKCGEYSRMFVQNLVKICTADFHALRKTFITNLSKSGVSSKMAQSLARHSDINLTMNVYTVVVLEDQAIAVELGL